MKPAESWAAGLWEVAYTFHWKAFALALLGFVTTFYATDAGPKLQAAGYGTLSAALVFLANFIRLLASDNTEKA